MRLLINSVETYSEQPAKRLRYGIEKFEAESWIDMNLSASDEVKKQLGIKLIPINLTFAAIIPAADVIALNRIIGLGLDKPFDRVVLEKLKYDLIMNNVKRFFIQLHPDAQPDCAYELLEQCSFTYYNNWVKYYRDNSPSHNFKTDFLIREIGKSEALTFAEILLKNFNWPDILLPFFAATVGRRNWKHYMAYDGDTPVATATSYIRGKYARLGFGSTLPEYRGKGIQLAMLSRRIEDCRKLGVKEMTLETAEDKPDKPSISKKNVIRSGFEIAYIRPNYIFKV